MQNEIGSVTNAVRLGIDVGKKRIGVAKAEAGSNFALDIGTVTLDGEETGVERVAEIAKDNNAEIIYVGLPLSLSGEHSDLTNYVIDWAGYLAKVVDAEIRLTDERFSSSVAHMKLETAGRKRKKHKKVIDRCAAREILQGALDFEALNGKLSGAKYGETCV